MSDQEALFDSTHEALIFAFNYADQQFAKSLMARLYAKHGKGKGLSGVDGAGEAGMIMASVNRLAQAEQDALCVRYTKVKSCCKGCGHEVNTPAVDEALSRLENYVKQANYCDGMDISDDKREQLNKKVNGVLNSINLMLIRAVIRAHFGIEQFGTLKVLAEKHKVHEVSACRYQSYVRTILKRLEQKANHNIKVELEKSGKVNNEVCA